MRWIIPVLAVIVIGGGGLHSLGYLDRWLGGETDLNIVASEFNTAWNSGDRGEVAAYFHPQVSDSIADGLESVVERAGWEAGYGTVNSADVELLPVQPGTAQTGKIHMSLAGAPAWADVKWQFEPSKNRWLITSMRFAPPPISDRVAELQEIWGKSEVGAMKPMFSKANAQAGLEVFGKYVKNRKWKTWPALTSPVTTGEDVAGDPATDLNAHKVSTTFETSAGQLTVRWGFNGKHYDWMVSGWDFPPL